MVQSEFLGLRMFAHQSWPSELWQHRIGHRVDCWKAPNGRTQWQAGSKLHRQGKTFYQWLPKRKGNNVNSHPDLAAGYNQRTWRTLRGRGGGIYLLRIGLYFFHRNERLRAEPLSWYCFQMPLSMMFYTLRVKHVLDLSLHGQNTQPEFV